MKTLDLKDRKILYELDLNSRQSFRSLGMKVGLSKDAVKVRVQKLIEQGIIFNFYTYIDLSKFGYTVLRLYLKLQYTTLEIRNKIIQELVDNIFSIFVNSCEGDVEISVYFAVKNVYEFQKIWHKFYREYGYYFAKIWFSIWCNESMYCYSFLLENNLNKRTDKKNMIKFGEGPQIDIDTLDYQILQIISTDSRIPSSEIAKKLDVSIDNIKNRISRLQKNGIIQAYKIDIAYNKLDYNHYRLDVYLKNHKVWEKINDYITDKPLIKSAYVSLGDAADLEYELYVKDITQLRQVMEDIIEKFPECIRNYRYYSPLKRYKMRFMV